MAEQIIIDIHNSTNAKEITGTLIHQAEVNTVTRWVDEQLLRAREPSKERLHETITVSGTRGSGKSTFLLSISRKLSDRHPNLCVLRIIDPTLSEEKGHIFLDIISRIKKEVDTKLSQSELDPGDPSFLQKKAWNDDVLRLAHGLPQLDGIGGRMTEQNWQDAEYIMHNGLNAVESARELEVNFHRLVENALKILEKDAFLIPFDDIDIDFIKGWRVIETIRKYFTTPRIITMISGDLRLYAKAIRKQQWKNFGKALLVNEGEQQDKMSEFNELVTEMESQYMQKVMQLNKRITLTSLNEKLLLYEGLYEFSVKNIAGNTIGLTTYYNRVLNRFGIYSESQLDTFRSFLLSQPLRTQIQFMSAVDYTEPRRYLDHFRVSGAFLNDLFEKQVDINLANNNPKFLNTVILELLIRTKTLDLHYQLQPTSRDRSLDSSLVALSLLSTEKMSQDPYLIFDYLIKIGYIRNLATAFPSSEPNDSPGVPSVSGLVAHAGVYQDKVLRDMVGLINAYVRGALNMERNNVLPWGGTIILYSFGTIVKKGQDEARTRIDRVFMNDATRNIAYIPLSIAQPNRKQSGQLVYSIYSLLATIGELCRKHADVDQDLYEFSQIRTYPMPEFRTGQRSGAESYNFDELETERYHRDEFLEEIEHLMRRWVTRHRNLMTPPHLLGKLSTRFFYALMNMDANEKGDNLGEMFSLRIAAFLNSVLIEDAKESQGRVYRGINYNNVNTSYKTLIDNLAAVRDHKTSKNDLAFSRWLFSCPLLLVYLDPEIVERLNVFTESEDYGNVVHLSVFSGLRSVSVRGAVPVSRNEGPAAYRALVERLRRDEIPFAYFDEHSPGSTLSKNNYIRENLRQYFGENTDSGSLRAFRRFLSSNRIQW